MSGAKWEIGQKLVNPRESRLTLPYTANDAAYGQEYWETRGWRAAESPAAPVERALAPRWRYDKACETAQCAGCADWLFEKPALVSPLGKYHCPPCAEKAGAFATPAPAVTVAARENLLNGTWGAPVAPAASPAPRCEYRTSAHEGTPVERVMLVSGVAKRLLACDVCYLERERVFAANMPCDPVPNNRPRATIGVVPQCFGLSVGILSRGMAIAAVPSPKPTWCPIHPGGGCDGGTGCTRPR